MNGLWKINMQIMRLKKQKKQWFDEGLFLMWYFNKARKLVVDFSTWRVNKNNYIMFKSFKLTSFYADSLSQVVAV